MENIQQIEVRGMMVLTTKQIAEMYETDTNTISHNFRRNKNKYLLGKHYIEIQGEDLKELKRTGQSVLSLKQVKHLYLWTERGALLHAKSINTPKAWEAYEFLVDHYFRTKDATRQQAPEEVVPVKTKTEPVPEGIAARGDKKSLRFPEINQPAKALHALLNIAEKKRINVLFGEMKYCRSILCSDHIGIRKNMSVDEIVYELAFELAHAMVHYDVGNIVQNPNCKEYNAFAERMACMMIELLNTQMEKVG